MLQRSHKFSRLRRQRSHAFVLQAPIDRLAADAQAPRGGADVAAAFHKILGYIDIGRSADAKCLTGGERLRAGDETNDGFFVKPMLLFG